MAKHNSPSDAEQYVPSEPTKGITFKNSDWLKYVLILMIGGSGGVGGLSLVKGDGDKTNNTRILKKLDDIQEDIKDLKKNRDEVQECLGQVKRQLSKMGTRLDDLEDPLIGKTKP